MGIEIERKFVFEDSTIIKITKLGGRLVKEEVFKDIYFDDSAYTLTRKDCWLRKRDEKWQLKIKCEEKNDNANLESKFNEIEDHQLILKNVSDILKNETSWSEESNIEALTTVLGCGPFAEFQTRRKKFEMDDSVGIDLDEADYGYKVGEIEVVVESNSDIPEALKKIEKVASALGMKLLNDVGMSIIAASMMTGDLQTP